MEIQRQRLLDLTAEALIETSTLSDFQMLAKDKIKAELAKLREESQCA